MTSTNQMGMSWEVNKIKILIQSDMIRWLGFPAWADWTDSKPILDFEPKVFNFFKFFSPKTF